MQKVINGRACHDRITARCDEFVYKGVFRKKPIAVQCYDVIRPVLIETEEGMMDASPGDIVILGIMGELYPVKSGIFNKSFARVRRKE